LRLLIYLLEHRNHTISKEKLLDCVWPDSYVGENALTSAICELRRALDDDGAAQDLIRTERGRGYRFIANVEEYSAPQSSSPITTVAVLPFVDMSRDGDHGYLADGLTEELIHALAKVHLLQVVSRTSAFAFKHKREDLCAIAAELHTGTIVEGSVRISDNRARVTAQLIGAADGYHLWSQTYDRPLDDVLALEEEIAQEIRGEIEKLLLRRSTRSGHGTPGTL
jgi:TolB-like protein